MNHRFEPTEHNARTFRHAVFRHCVMAEIHPFDDANGPISRILTTWEFLSIALSWIVTPTVDHDHYPGKLLEIGIAPSLDAINRYLGIAINYADDRRPFYLEMPPCA